MAELSPEEKDAIQDWWDSSTPTEKKETAELYWGMWKTVKEADCEERDAYGKCLPNGWSAKDFEAKLETVEKFVMLIVALLLGPFSVGILPIIAVVNELQRFYMTTPAKERSAVRLWTWLDNRKKLTDNQRKVGFIIGIWIGPAQPAPAAHSLLGETIGRGFDNFDVPWDDFLSIWGWGDAGADVSLDPHAFVPFEWAPDVATGPKKAGAGVGLLAIGLLLLPFILR